MAGIYNDDESTEDEIDVDFHLGERLRINRGENCNFVEDKMFENSKDFKQYCNMHRKKFSQEGQSSSSSSIEMQNDHPSSGLMSSDHYHNKKRQNGDKTTEQLANPKRTCLSDRFHRSPDWRDYRKKTNNHDSQSETSLFPDSLYLHRSTSPDVFPNKKCEEHVNSLADAEDSDFEIPVKINRHVKLDSSQGSKNSKIQFNPPKVQGFENKASTSYYSKFLDSGSDDESKSVMQNGALKGGRQESTADPPCYSKKTFGHKVNRKVLDSDESEDDNSVTMYRSRPLIFSSSDSEDFKQSSTKSKHIGASANGSTGHSHSYGDDFEEHTGSHSSKFKPFRPSQKLTKKSVCSSNRADSSDGCDRQFLSADFQRKAAPNRSGKSRRSARVSMSTNLAANGFSKSSNASGPVRGRRICGNERATRRSGSPHHRSNRCQRKSDEGKSRFRSVSMSRTQAEKPSYAARYPDVFDAEESDNEFFTANSYSDTETSTESLGGLTINTNFPTHNGSVSCTINCEDGLFDDVSSDEEISVVFSSGPCGRNNEARRGASRTLGRRHCRGTPHRQLPNAREVVSLSPDPVELVRQMEEDERMARMLQAQFDAEVDPNYVPVSSNSVIENDDSDDDIIDPLGDSDSDSSPHATIYPFAAILPINRRGIGAHRFTSNRSGTPTFFFGNRRTDARSRRRTHIAVPRERPENHYRIFGFGMSDFSFLNDYETLLSLDLDDEVVPRGLPKSDINRLPTRKYIHPNSALSSSSSEVTHKRTELNKECQVCLTDYETGDVLRILPCFHEFHTPCIDPWLTINHTCPVCRVTVDLDA